MQREISVVIPAAETAQAQMLSKSVRDRSLTDEKVDLSGIKVVLNKGTVYLSGTVHSLDARQQAIKRIWGVRRVRSVVNSLEVNYRHWVNERRLSNLAVAAAPPKPVLLYEEKRLLVSVVRPRHIPEKNAENEKGEQNTLRDASRHGALRRAQ